MSNQHKEVSMVRHLFILAILLLSTKVFALPVQFTNKELAAVYTLMRPELNAIELHGRKANFTPSPSMKYLGLEQSSTPLDLTVIANIVDLEFNHIRAKTPEIKFQNGVFELRVAVEDRVKGVQSYLGSISFKDVAVRAQVGWQARSNGSQELVLLKTYFDGTLKGTGILKSDYILGKTRDLCLSELTKAIRKFLTTEKLQNAIQAGLLEYGKFYSGMDAKELTPGSIQFVSDGIKFNVD